MLCKVGLVREKVNECIRCGRKGAEHKSSFVSKKVKKCQGMTEKKTNRKKEHQLVENHLIFNGIFSMMLISTGNLEVCMVLKNSNSRAMTCWRNDFLFQIFSTLVAKMYIRRCYFIIQEMGFQVWRGLFQ